MKCSNSVIGAGIDSVFVKSLIIFTTYRSPNLVQILLKGCGRKLYLNHIEIAQQVISYLG